MIDRLISLLQQELDLTAEEIADIFWLTLIQHREAGEIMTNTVRQLDEQSQSSVIVNTDVELVSQKLPPKPAVVPQSHSNASIPPAEVYSRPPQTRSQFQSEAAPSLPFSVPDASALRGAPSLVRALRPLQQRVPSSWVSLFDETTTAQCIAETKIWLPALQPDLEPWLDLALVVDSGPSMLIWRRTVLEFQRLLRQYGFFRDVRTWSLDVGKGQVCLRPGLNPIAARQAPHSPKEILDPNGRRLILVVSDCVSDLWQTGMVSDALQVWVEHGPTALVQVLPEWLWDRTALRQIPTARLYSLDAGVANQALVAVRRDRWRRPSSTDIKLPVFTLEPEVAHVWSQMVAGKGNQGAPGLIFSSGRSAVSYPPTNLDPEQRVQRFRVFASPMARRLAGLLAAAPVVNMPIIRLIQDAMLRQSQQVHVAEVLLGGLLKPTEPITPATDPDEVEYEFYDEAIRESLQSETPVPDLVRVLSKLIDQKFNESLDDFIAIVCAPQPSTTSAAQDSRRPFALVAIDVLKRKGGRYAEFARDIERQVRGDFQTPSPPSPAEVNTTEEWQTFEFNVATVVELQTMEVEVATIALGSGETEPRPDTGLTPFEFEAATIAIKQTGRFRKKTAIEIHRQRQQAWQFTEDLGNGIALEMVAIPEGSFMMGAPKEEPDSLDSERPQHRVSVQSFLLGKYPVTQAQWRAVAAMDQVNRELSLDPSHFKGDERPVESVSWYEAVEFCDRLSHQTGRDYGLPSEAEWEYACRAGTTTPFHFGETITPELANYYSEVAYSPGPTVKSRGETTDVGSFSVANAFGLYDMHGNLWEWCADHWHENYKEAPTDGSAWLAENKNNFRMLRGGSWYGLPESCRSAFRSRYYPDDRSVVFGFRVACAAARTL